MPRLAPRSGVFLTSLIMSVALVLAACSAGPSHRPAVAYHDGPQPIPAAPPAPRPAPVPPLGSPARDTLNWQDCTEQTRTELDAPSAPVRFSCARLLTDLHSPEPSGIETSRVSVLATGTGTIPLVMLNDIDGEPGTTAAARLAQRLPPEMLNTFKLIGMDRRGTGTSDAANCVLPAQREAITGFAPRADDRAASEPLLDTVRAAGQHCLLDLDERAQSYDTWRTADDLEELRIRLNVPTLHALGRGEASRVLTTYSERFPHSVGRMVLDGAPDPQQDAMGQSESDAREAERVFDAFAAECSNGGACPLGTDVRTTVANLVERARVAGLPTAGAPVSAGGVVQAILTGLQDRESWPVLVRALDAANHGDGGGLSTFVAPLTSGDAQKPARLDGTLITRCNDTAVRLPAQRSNDLVGEWTSRYPLFGGKFAQRLLTCTGWPLPQEAPPAPTNPQLPPIPVITTAHDPSTPATGSDHMAQQLRSGTSITWQGTGHGALGRSDCVTSAVSRFLIQGTVPTPGTACPA